MTYDVGNFYLGTSASTVGKLYLCTGGNSTQGEFIRIAPPDGSLTPYKIHWDELG
jgi:hypothetical protein